MMEPQERDLRLLAGLFESRLMTLAQLASIYFEGRSEAAKKRLQVLKRAGLVTERPRRPHERSILFLSRSGLELARTRGYLLNYPVLNWTVLKERMTVSDLTLKHELSVVDVKTAIYSAIRLFDNLRIVEFSTWPLLFQFEASPGPNERCVVVKPDGFIRIQQREADGDMFEQTFYLEVDRSTETLDTLLSRADCYIDHYRRGGLATRSGRPATEYKEFPFRTLFVVQNAERRNNLAERLLLRQPPILSQVWLTTMKEIMTDSLGPIWIRPVDYRNAVADSKYKVSASPPISGYRRRGDREAFVEAAVVKHRLLFE